MRETVFEISGLHSAQPGPVMAAMDMVRAQGSLAVHTEVTAAQMGAFHGHPWHFVHPILPGHKHSEMVISWNPKVFEEKSSWTIPLTHIGWKVGNVHRSGVSAVAVHLQHLESGKDGVVYGLHWPSGIFNFPVRLRAHKQTTAVLSAHVHHRMHRRPNEWLMVAGDTNVDHHRPAMRSAFESSLGLDDLWSDSQPSGGSHGNRIIDAIFASKGMKIRNGKIHKQTPASDHRMISGDVEF